MSRRRHRREVFFFMTPRASLTEGRPGSTQSEEGVNCYLSTLGGDFAHSASSARTRGIPCYTSYSENIQESFSREPS
jgi:hypothetical protein